MRLKPMMMRAIVMFCVMILTISNAAQTENAQVIAMSSYLNLRDAPTQTAPVIAELSSNTPLIALARTRDNAWYRVQLVDGRTGWVASAYVSLNADVVLPFDNLTDNVAGDVVDNPSGSGQPDVPAESISIDATEGNARVNNSIWGTLNMRDAPTTNSTVIAELSAGNLLTVLEQDVSGVWLRVQFGDITGWVARRYIDFSASVSVTSEPVANDDIEAQIVEPVTPNNMFGGDIATIALQGRTLGNVRTNFSMVGDSMTYSEMFMRPIVVSAVNLGANAYLQGTIEHFSQGQNSFSRTSMSAGNGWTTEIVLDPEFASSANCMFGETPLDCEYRIARPAVSLIMLGSNDVALMPRDVYAHNLGMIVQKTIEQGIVPIVSTIPYRVGYEAQVEAFNQTVRDVAALYNIPVWDYFGAMLSLPNAGLGVDGLHPSIPNGGIANAANFTDEYLVSGYVIRNLTGLQVLHDVLQGALR